eukprot:Em0003g944a
MYRVLIFFYTFGWLVTVGVQSTDRFIIYLTIQSFLLLNLSLLFLAMLTVAYATLYYSLIYWVANGRTKEGVIYPILDYGAADKQMAIVFAMVLVLFPMIIYLILFGIALLRDVAFQLLKRVFFWDFWQKEFAAVKPNTDRDVVV